VSRERSSQQIVSVFIISGLIFMLLPGTFLGVWNLISISQANGPGSLSQAWLQAHGQAQVFGWIGSFILGVGFYSLTKMQSTLDFPTRDAWMSWALWTTGVGLRWIAGVVLWRWRILLPLSALLELAGYGLFLSAVRRHRPKKEGAGEVWLRLVAAGSSCFLVVLLANCVAVFYVALYTGAPILSHVLDQELVLLAVWGIIVPTIWGFNARWLPIFGGLQQPNGKLLLAAYLISVAGLIAVFLNQLGVAAALLLVAGLMSVEGLHAWSRAIQPPKLLNIHPTFVTFVRLAYVWLIVSCLLFALAVTSDQDGGIWGASRHALTVGFVAGMVFVIGPRVLPAFCGMRILWSKGLMFWALLLLHVGCALRVVAEPLAYENDLAMAWHVLPVSAVIELTAVSLFALNIGVTLLQPAAHLRKQRTAT
jgi:hypothetical protein